MTLTQTLTEKIQTLENCVRSTVGGIAVAFSYGVDSTFLLKFAHDILGDEVVAVTVRSPFVPAEEIDGSINFCKKEGIKQIIIDADILSSKDVCSNPPDRCYICKKYIFSQITSAAKSAGIINVYEGTNADDINDYRPGMKALDELCVQSPLMYAELTKAEIRALSEELNLPTSSKPSFACLATRIAVGEQITKEKLQMVEKAESFLHKNGFYQVRVRVHGNIARIETEKSDIVRLASLADETSAYLKDLGFKFVSLDLSGYKTGSMNLPL